MYQAPVEFTVAPSDAVPLALERSGLSMHDVDFHEINEAFSVVALANMQVCTFVYISSSSSSRYYFKLRDMGRFLFC